MLQAGKQMDVPEAPGAPSLLSEAGRGWRSPHFARPSDTLALSPSWLG